jgi:hypothetical protein
LVLHNSLVGRPVLYECGKNERKILEDAAMYGQTAEEPEMVYKAASSALIGQWSLAVSFIVAKVSICDLNGFCW